VAVGKHGGRSNKLEAHILNHKHEEKNRGRREREREREREIGREGGRERELKTLGFFKLSNPHPQCQQGHTW
jgi:hypothetical protein